MRKILITGASGNVGSAVASYLLATGGVRQILIATRDLSAGKAPEGTTPVFFDFTKPERSLAALKQVDALFLMRPPQIADVDRYFKPIVKGCVDNGVSHIVFLSVQGIGRNPLVPHFKIEKLIAASNIPYTFIRPTYFMQNLTTTLWKEINEKKEIAIPAGDAAFNWVDADDVALIAACALEYPFEFRNRTIKVCGPENLTFRQVVGMIRKYAGKEIAYRSPGLLQFVLTKRREGYPMSYIFVLIMLHYFQRFQKPPDIYKDFTVITGCEPSTFKDFITANANKF